MAKIPGETGAHRVHKGTQQSAKATDGSIVERGDNGRVYRYVPEYDHTIIMQGGRSSQPMRGNQLPSVVNANSSKSGGIDGMIDEVLERSGMTQPRNVPTPTERPATEDEIAAAQSGMTGTDQHPGKMADDANVGLEQADVADASDTEASGIKTLGGYLLAALGLGVGGKAIYDAYKGGYRPQSGSAEVPEASVDNPEGYADADVEKQGRIPMEERLLLEGPRNAVTDQQSQVSNPQDMYGNELEMDKNGWPAGTDKWAQRPVSNPTDESIAATIGDDEFDQRFAANVEGTADRPSTQNRFKPGQGRIAPKLAQDVKALADSGDLRGAIMMLRENGIGLDDRMLQSIIENSPATAAMRSQVKGLAQRAGRKAVSQ